MIPSVSSGTIISGIMHQILLLQLTKHNYLHLVTKHNYLHLVNEFSHLAILNQNVVAEQLCAFFFFYPAGEDQQHRGEPCGPLLLSLMVPAMQAVHAQANRIIQRTGLSGQEL